MSDAPPTRSSLTEEPTGNRGGPVDMRTRTARGTLINSAFQVGLAGLGLVRRVAVAAFLTREQFGVWGIILATLITLVWLKQVGIADKYIQQSEPDQELAYQRAFTLEFLLSCAYFVVCCAVLPLYGLAYGHPEIVLPGVVLATSVILTAFESPTWIPYRRMEYARQRTLSSVDPVVSIVATIALAAAGFGIWGLVAGALIGSVAGAAVCVATCPYPLRFRFHMGTVREYASFSWPLLGLGVAQLLTVQGSLLVANRAVGLAGVGAIGLSTSIAAFSDRVDGIVSQTLYPAVCAVADRVDRLREVFVKSNRVALMWAMPFAVGLALFAHDFVQLAFGDRWLPAVGLLQAIGLSLGFGQVAFNWTVFMRAANRTRPLFVAALLQLAVYALVLAPATLAWGLTGYAIGFALSTLVQVFLRGYYLRTMFGKFSVVMQAARAVAPTIPAAAAVLAVRAVTDAPRTVAVLVSELVLYSVATLVCTYVFERPLVRELVGYVRGRAATKPAPVSTSVPTRA